MTTPPCLHPQHGYQSWKRFSKEISLPFHPPSTGRLALLDSEYREGQIWKKPSLRVTQKKVNQSNENMAREAETLPPCRPALQWTPQKLATIPLHAAPGEGLWGQTKPCNANSAVDFSPGDPISVFTVGVSYALIWINTAVTAVTGQNVLLTATQVNSDPITKPPV